MTKQQHTAYPGLLNAGTCIDEEDTDCTGMVKLKELRFHIISTADPKRLDSNLTFHFDSDPNYTKFYGKFESHKYFI